VARGDALARGGVRGHPYLFGAHGPAAHPTKNESMRRKTVPLLIALGLACWGPAAPEWVAVWWLAGWIGLILPFDGQPRLLLVDASDGTQRESAG